MNDVDSAKALMVLFLNLDFKERQRFLFEVRNICLSRNQRWFASSFLITTLDHHFEPIHEVIAQGGEDDDDRHMGIYALGHYDNDQRKALDVRYDSFADYYIDNDGNDWFDAILLTLCECRCDLTMDKEDK